MGGRFSMNTIREQQGVAAVEFAIIAPLLFVLVFGIIEFGLLLYDKQIITNASREAARAGIVQGSPRPTATEIKNVVTAYAQDKLFTFGGPGLHAPTVSTSNPGGADHCTVFGQDLIISVTYTYDFLVFPNLIKLLHGVFSDTIDLTAVTVMRCE